MSVRFSCPHCRHDVEVPPRLTARDQACPACGRTIRAPASGLYPGVVIDSMRIDRRLGRGSMGEVYLATHLNLDRKVALKVLSPNFTGNREAVERFMKEVRNLAKLTHPNLVTAYTAGTCEDIRYLAMSYVAGETMHDRIRRKGPLPEEEALSVVLCVARALHYAWDRHHILHRDVKPANIMVDDDGEIKLTDLGLSKSLLEEGEATQSGLLIGTPHYMSPEQVRSEPVTDVRTDIYGLGATLHHMLCGTPPFPLENVRDILRGHLSTPPPSVREKRPGITAATAKLVSWMMAKEVEKRPASWSVVETELESILQQHFPMTDTQTAVGSATQAAETVVAEAPSPRSLGLVLVAVASVVLAAGAMFYVLRPPHPAVVNASPAVPVVAESLVVQADPEPAGAVELPPRVRALRAHLSPRIREVMLKLDRDVIPLVQQRRWTEAAAVYRNYRGPLARETERLRAATADRLLENQPPR